MYFGQFVLTMKNLVIRNRDTLIVFMPLLVVVLGLLALALLLVMILEIIYMFQINRSIN